MKTETTTVSKSAVCGALLKFINQRSGIEYANYGGRESFMGDYRPILRYGVHDRRMLRYVELSSITAEQLIEASRAFSGRLQFIVRDDGFVGVDYTTGQYFPTEYRNAACAVLAQAIWTHWSDNCNVKTGDDIAPELLEQLGSVLSNVLTHGRLTPSQIEAAQKVIAKASGSEVAK